jgi:CheY-like chemotaxis protein
MFSIRTSSMLSASASSRYDVPLSPYDYPQRGPGRVLIIDDEAALRMLISRQLELAGFDVISASNGPEGLELLRADPTIRLMLLDLMMPGMDGWRVRRAHLADPQLARVPTVILTGAPLPSLVHEQLRAADYLLKPVGRDHLVSVVSNYCEPTAHAA